VCGSTKPSTAQKNFIDLLKKHFDKESNKFYHLLQSQDIELGELTKIKDTSVKNAIDKDAVVQNNTLNILKATFGKEKMEKLRSRLDNVQDDVEKYEIEMEIAQWEKIL
jgi:hemerythrin-like domain-containing protein